MILSQLLPDNLPIVKSTIGENLGFIYESLEEISSNEASASKMEQNILYDRTRNSTRNSFYQLLYITEGEAILEHASQKNVIRDRSFIYYAAPGRAQKITVRGKVKGHLLFISKEILVDILNKLPDATRSYRDEAFILDLALKRENHSEIAILENALISIQEEIAKEESLGLRALLLCWIRLAYIVSFRLAHHGSALFLCQHRHAEKFRRYLHLIDEHFREHWALPLYAKHLNITVSTLNNICRELGGLPAKEYVAQRLVKEAEFYLKYQSLSIIEIAHQLGFKDSSYFTRFFKRHAAITPTAYRQKIDDNNRDEEIVPNHDLEACD